MPYNHFLRLEKCNFFLDKQTNTQKNTTNKQDIINKFNKINKTKIEDTNIPISHINFLKDN
jgi:hypothetical protein